MKKNIVLFFSLLFALNVVAQQDNAVESDSTFYDDEVCLDCNVRIDEVVVTGTFEGVDVRHLPMTISRINRVQLENNFQQSILPTVAEKTPGLFITSRGILGYGVSTGAAGGIKMRGIGGDPSTGMLVLIDGHPQYMGLMGHSVADVYQAMLAERVEIIRGPSSVLYGSNAMGGVMNIITRRMQDDGVKTHARLSSGMYGTIESEISNMARKGGFNSMVVASYNRTDGHRPDMGFEQFGGYLKLGYDFDHWKIWADAQVTHFNSENPGPIDAHLNDNDSHITRGVASIALENHYDKMSGSLSAFYNYGFHKIDDGYKDGASPLNYFFHSKDYMMGASLRENFFFFKGNITTFGVDYQRFGGKAWNADKKTDKVTNDIADKSLDEVAGYINFQQDVVDWFSLNAAIRVDYHTVVGLEWIPQGGLAFHLPKEADIKAMVSKGFRNPTIKEMYMFPPQNPDLKPERLMNYEVSFSQKLVLGKQYNRFLNYGVNVYYMNGNNVITTEMVDGKKKNVNSGAIENYGVEADVNFHINEHWNVNANYSWLNMENPVVSAPEHKLYVGGTFKYNRWYVSTGIQYINGLYTSVVKGKEKQEDFVLWDAKASFQACKQLTVFIKGENLLGQRYEIMEGFPMPRATVKAGVDVKF